MSTRSKPTIGLFHISHLLSRPGGDSHIATLAETLGYDSLWAGEHVVLPTPRVAPSPMEPEDPILDPIVSLTHAAAVTRNIRLGTGIIILPQRNPLVLAKQLASLDVISNGRLIFGLGVGYLEPELRAIGVPLEHRFAMSEEYLRAMQSLWYDKAPAYDGAFVRFSGIDAHPRPVQQPIPIVVGGRAPAAHRRAVEWGDGWYGYWLSPEETSQQIESLKRQSKRVGRERPLHISVSPQGRLTRERVETYAGLGVDRLVLVPRAGLSPGELEAFVRANAPLKVGGAPAPWM